MCLLHQNRRILCSQDWSLFVQSSSKLSKIFEGFLIFITNQKENFIKVPLSRFLFVSRWQYFLLYVLYLITTLHQHNIKSLTQNFSVVKITMFGLRSQKPDPSTSFLFQIHITGLSYIDTLIFITNKRLNEFQFE